MLLNYQGSIIAALLAWMWKESLQLVKTNSFIKRIVLPPTQKFVLPDPARFSQWRLGWERSGVGKKVDANAHAEL